MNKVIRVLGLSSLVLLSLVPVQGCTDLSETPSSSITPENFYRNEAEVLGGLAAVYAQLRSTLDDYWYATEVSSDEMVVPTRGSDWYDNGQWLELKRQSWTASSPSTLAFMNGSWNVPFIGIARANVLLDALTRVTVPNQGTIVAELRTLRGFYYYLLMDMFGGVPIVTDIEIKPRARNTRTEVFDFIETELLAARADLPDNWPAGSNGRLTKGAADAILANMYLNAGVWRKDAGVSATSYNTCLGVTVSGGADACQAAIDAADRIINSGQYSLAANYTTNFVYNNQTSPENIMVVKFLNQTDLGLNFVMRALHYNQYAPSPWNGFATMAQTYNAYDANDARRGETWLAGPQVNVETGLPVNDRQGNPLVFTPTIGDVTAATEGEGARLYKWPADPGHVEQNNGNDFAYFRLGEIYLIKAEALNEQSAGSAAALLLVNALRARAFNPAQPRATIDRDQLLQERLFELGGEAKRRQDLIRHGHYTDAWEFKTAGTPNLILMPIPQTQLDANPLLEQNPGY
ncbi:MAG TPA: RagB/SusD family nutrient uptake outer membrane protein [Gemmatimonadales bacterium]|nr:RagB/SusD family nutrient uptake outer membrane protein [Gemmatimonadales bacterium]